MPNSSKRIAVLAIACLISGIFLLHRGINKPKIGTAHIDTSIVRLHDVSTGRFFCSGVVISRNMLLTAAHCIVREGFFGVEVVQQVNIRTADGRDMGLIAILVGANPRQDVAVLGGDFSLFDHMDVEIAPKQLEHAYLHSAIKACGYPEGGELVCTDVTHVAHFGFGFSADGFLYPGMSGGPVIDEATDKVIGVNTAVMESRIYLSPTIELYKQIGL